MAPADPFAGRRLLIVGLARQGSALARFAHRRGARVTVTDRRTADELGGAVAELVDCDINFVFGEHSMDLLANTDILAISGGVPADAPLVLAARERGIPVTNDSLEFARRAPAPIIGITGSAGKTTTTALVGAMGRAAGRRTWVGGNIGRPLLADLDEMTTGDLVVQELSSFQLELWDRSPAVAAVLNVTPNHLDRHGTMAAYATAKGHILDFQRREDVAVLGADDAGARAMWPRVKGRLRHFSLESEVDDGAYARDGRIFLRDGLRERAVAPLDSLRLRGRHNAANALAATAVADAAGLPIAAIAEALTTFAGVPHRLETVRELDGVRYVNDSIATAPERVLAALDAYDAPLILLAGGRDKAMVWERWAERVRDRARLTILFGELGSLLADHLDRAGARAYTRVATLDEAVAAARAAARPGDVVLLSPGGTSFDAYADFAARGDHFRRLTAALT